jgi:hypothetical protein
MDRAETLKTLIEQQKGIFPIGEVLSSCISVCVCVCRLTAKTYHEQIQITDGSIGHSYEKIFARFLDATVTYVSVQDPYIRAFHQVSDRSEGVRMFSMFIQICNFLRFCEMLLKSSASIKRIDLMTSTETVDRIDDVH